MNDPQRFLPYGKQSIDEDDIARVVECLRGAWLTGGPYVTAFEAKLAEITQAPHAVACANGTAALHLCMLVADLKPGDEVLVPANTFLATANCVSYVGARVVFVDVDSATGLISLRSLRAQLSARTRAVIPVHFAGAAMDIRTVKDIVGDDILIVEDAAHALGATHDSVPVGACSHSTAAIFSFHPVKGATTGEGGAITTRDPTLAHRLANLRSHGMERDASHFQSASPGRWYYEMQELGFNYRLSDIQCALGLGQLEKLPAFVERRRAIASLYDELLKEVAGVKPLKRLPESCQSAWHLYVVLIDFKKARKSRSQVMEALAERGIGTQVHYIPIPLQPYYAALGYDTRALPGTNTYYEQALSLPLFPTLEEDDVRRVVRELQSVLDG